MYFQSSYLTPLPSSDFVDKSKVPAKYSGLCLLKRNGMMSISRRYYAKVVKGRLKLYKCKQYSSPTETTLEHDINLEKVSNV